jgi:hypothetical protein
VSDALPELAYVEHALPGSPAERLELARRLDLALEVAHRPETDVEAIGRSGLRVATVQAWRLHEVHPLHPDASVRARAAAVVEQAMVVALRLGAPRVLTVCGFGSEVCDAPFERCLGFFAALAISARNRGLRLLIELLGPHRAAAMSTPEELQRLLDALDEPQLRGPDSTAPGAGLPLERWIGARTPAPAVIAVEHHGALPPGRCETLIGRVRAALGPHA